MKSHLNLMGFCLVTIAFLISGCTHYPPIEEVTNKINRADKALKDAKEIVFAANKPHYLKEINKIGAKLNHLSAHWESMPFKEIDESCEAIEKQCQTIVDKIRADFIREMTALKEAIQKGQNEQLADYIEELTNLLDKYKKPVSTMTLKEDVQKWETIRDEKQQKFQTETFFGLGKYALSDRGQKQLDNWFNTTIYKEIKKTAKDYKDEPVTLNIHINIIGYTDGIGFRKSTARRLRDDCKQKNKNIRFRTRKDLNLCLSEKRVESISDYLEDLIGTQSQKLGHMDIKLKSEIESVGKGEELPPFLKGRPHSKNDKRRRICIIECRFKRSGE